MKEWLGNLCFKKCNSLRPSGVQAKDNNRKAKDNNGNGYTQYLSNCDFVPGS